MVNHVIAREITKINKKNYSKMKMAKIFRKVYFDSSINAEMGTYGNG